MLFCEGSARVARGFACIGLAAFLASAALADDFGEKMKGGQPPAFRDPLVPTDCEQCPCPPTQEQQESAETRNGTNQSSTGSQCGTGGDPVDAYTGRLFLERTDLVVNGVVPIRMVRQYDSQSRFDSPLGYGWSFTYDTRLFEYSNGEVVVRGWEGRRWRYLPPTPPATQFIPDNPNGGRLPVLERDTVAGDPVEYVLTYYSGDRALFDNEGRLYAIETPQGNRLRFFYSAQKMPLSGMSPYALVPTQALTVAHVWQLTDIKEQLRSQVGSTPEVFTGRFVHLVYNAGTGRLETITSHDGRVVSYNHDETGKTPTSRGNLAGVVGAHTASETGIDETFVYPVTPPSTGSTPAAFEHIHNLTTYGYGLFATPHIVTYDVEKDRVTGQSYSPASWTFDYVESPTLKTTIHRTIITGASSQVANTVYDFNFDGFVTQKTDALGNVIQYSRSAGHETESVKVFEASSPPPGAPNRTIAFDYYADGRRASRSVDLPGEAVTESWQYAGPFTSEYKVQSTLPASNVFKTTLDFLLDAQGRPQNIQAVHRRKGDNGSGGDVVVTTAFTYDPAHGQLATITPPAASPADHLKIRRLYYTAADDLPGATPPLIRNGLLKAVEIISDDGTTTTADPHLARGFDYDAAGNVAAITDAKGHVTQLAWDGRGRLVRETRQIGATSATWESTLFRYGAPNNDGVTPGEYLLQVETGALGATGAATPGRIQRFVRDGRGNVTSVQRKDAFGVFAVRSSHVYDSDDNRIQSSEPTATGTRTLSFTYDRMKQLLTVKDSASPQNTTTFAYDAVGNRTQVEDANHRDTAFIYDDLDRLVEVIQQGNGDAPNLPAALHTLFRHDAAGNVTKVIDPKGQETNYAYDSLSRLLSVEQALGQLVQYRYDDRSRLFRVVNARENALDYFYAPWGGLESVLHYPTEGDAAANPPTNLERTVAYTHDLEGNVTSASDTDLLPGVSGPLFTVDPTTGYDERNRLHEIEVLYLPNPVTLTSTYNPFGERAQLDLTQGTETLSHVWTFDAMGRLDLATFPGSSTPIDFTPSADDTLARITRPSGTTTDYTYFPQGPIETITVKAGGTTQISRLAYAVNAVQNITNLSEQHATSDPTGAYVFGYDAANRLASAAYPSALGFTGNETFGYDAAGNRDDDPEVATPWSYDANNRIAKSPGFASYTFDDDGNLTARTGETFSYDLTNRLRAFNNGTFAASYAYDPFGRRIKKTVNGVTTWYVWDGDQLLAEYDASGARKVRYAYARGFAPAQVAYKNGSAEDVYDVHNDHLETPRLLTDGAGAVVWREAHDAFGKAHLDSGNTVTFNVRFPGQYFDAESGLHENRIRSYDSAIGRYVAVDPIGQSAGANLYHYVINQPVNLADPSGEGPITVGVCLAATFVGGAMSVNDILDISKEIKEARERIEQLSSESATCGDDKRQLEILDEVTKLKQEIASKELRRVAEGGLSGAAIGGATIWLCPSLVGLPTP